MSDDVLITPASRKVEFFDSAGNIDGKIELDSNGDLNITSTGSIAIGDITQDIHVGDGTQAVDLVFDFASSIYSVANQDLTIGKKSLGGNEVIIDTPTNLTVNTDSGNIDIGPRNTSFCHIRTDRSKFYFNKPLIIDGGDTNGDAYLISAYNTEDFVIATNNGTEDRITVKQATGNVGIGNTAPVSKLHVSGDTTIYNTTNEAHLVLRRDATGANYGSAIKWQFGDSASSSSGHEYARITGNIQDSTDGSEDGYLTLQTSKDGTLTEAVRINKDGNVGMGSTSPDAKLRIHQTDGSVHGLKVSRNDSSTSTPLVFLLDDSVYVDNPTLHVRNDRADQNGIAALFEGRVGIGHAGNTVTAPDQQLHVEGSVLIDAYNQGTTTLASNYVSGNTSLVLTDASTFNEKGTGTIDGVKFQWTVVDYSTNTLTVADLGTGYTAGVTVAADTGLFFREGFETDAQPSITIYDQNNSGASRDDLSINANSAIRMQLGGNAELKLTDDKLSLTPGNEDVASFVFRNRSDLGMFESGYNLQLAAPENVYIQIDSNNNNSDTKAFIVQKDASGVGGGTELFRVHENGHVIIRQAVANPTFLVHADTNSSPAPRIEMMRGAHDTWGTGDNYTDWRIENSNDLVFYSGFSTQSSGAAVERLRIHSDADGVTINGAYKFPASDGSANQVLQTDGNGALSFATVSGGGSDTNTFVIFGEEGDLYAGTGSTGNANGYQFSYGNGRANVQQSSSGTDFGINVPVDCTLTRVDVVFGNNGNVSSGTTTFVVVKNGTNQSGDLDTTHSSGVHDTHHTGLSHSFSAGDRFNLRTTTASKQVGPMRMTAYFTPT